ncbi:hypothetical protein WA588_000924 [Blastocystis sp. NMH]
MQSGKHPKYKLYPKLTKDGGYRQHNQSAESISEEPQRFVPNAMYTLEPSDERGDSWCLNNDPFGRIQDRQDFFDMGNMDSGRNVNGRSRMPPSGYNYRYRPPMNTMDDEMLNYDYNDPYSYSSTPGYVDYDSDLVEKPLPSTSTGSIFSPPYQSPYHLRESGPASPFSSQGYSYDSYANRSYQPSPMDSTRSTIFSSYQPPFYDSHDSFAHGAPDPLVNPPPPFNRAKPSPSFDPPLKSSPSYNSFPHASPAPRKTSPGVVHGARTEKPRSKPSSRGRRSGSRSEGSVLDMALQQKGCRMLQRQLERKGATAVAAIYAALGDEVQYLVMDQYGNYLFQKLVDMSSDDQRREVLRRVKDILPQASKNDQGTRCVQNLINVSCVVCGVWCSLCVVLVFLIFNISMLISLHYPIVVIPLSISLIHIPSQYPLSISLIHIPLNIPYPYPLSISLSMYIPCYNKPMPRSHLTSPRTAASATWWS